MVSELPGGWCTSALSGLADTVRGVTYNKLQAQSTAEEGLLPILRANNINSGKLVFDDLVFVPEDCVSRTQVLLAGDIVVAMSSGSRSVVGKSAQVEAPWPGSFGAFCGVLRASQEIDARYLYYFTQSRAYRDRVSELAAGVNINNLKPGHFEKISVPLAPLAEQKRIAQKLDALLAQVDTLKARIDAIPALLKRFRQGVLASAITGSLTGVALTATIQLSEVGEITGGITKNAKRTSFKLSVPYLRVANVQAGYLDLTEVHDIGVSPAEAKKTALAGGDILIVEGNGSLEHIGRAATWRGEIDGCCHQNHLIRWRSNGAALPEFVMIYLSSPQGRSDLMKVAKSTTGLHTLSISKISSVRLPVADMEQQQAIVRRVEQLFAYAEQLEAKVAAAQQRIDALTQSLLAKAFRGELVPQDPSDEPASVLLDRIRARRAATPKPKRGRKAATS
ncbi:restriction endonuclease subunit S [Xanthomonas oryzae]|uniref:restriction endonuclease subunit S n=1 Tax=Xanthomonas oryzae TaxID=347 RepID=UPI000949D513|nr:restriction endonuclease subunit S [Xanthomonas oryzae]URQ80833.1 restriction endonuclease subunit S [Xanthomonas oryzae pv. oryzae]